MTTIVRLQIAASVAAWLTLGLAALMPQTVVGQDSDQEIVYAGWGGRWQDSMRANVFDPFEQETGIEVVDVSGSSLAKLKAMIEAGRVEWDVVDVIGSWLVVGNQEGWFQELDLERIDTEGYPPGTVFPTAIAVDIYGIGLAYNTDALQDRPAPESWADFWDVEKYPGRRGVWDNPRYMLEFALLADGVAMDELYPLDVDRAFRKLDELKPHIDVYIRQWEQSGHLLASGGLALSVTGLARVYPIMAEGAPIGAAWNQSAIAYDYLVIPKGAANSDAAMDFIVWYANNGKAQADMARSFPQGPVNPDGMNHLTPDERAIMATNYLDQSFVVDWEWWAENLEEMEERWNEWKLR